MAPLSVNFDPIIPSLDNGPPIFSPTLPIAPLGWNRDPTAPSLDKTLPPAAAPVVVFSPWAAGCCAALELELWSMVLLADWSTRSNGDGWVGSLVCKGGEVIVEVVRDEFYGIERFLLSA